MEANVHRYTMRGHSDAIVPEEEKEEEEEEEEEKDEEDE